MYVPRLIRRTHRSKRTHLPQTDLKSVRDQIQPCIKVLETMQGVWSAIAGDLNTIKELLEKDFKLANEAVAKLQATKLVNDWNELKVSGELCAHGKLCLLTEQRCRQSTNIARLRTFPTFPLSPWTSTWRSCTRRASSLFPGRYHRCPRARPSCSGVNQCACIACCIFLSVFECLFSRIMQHTSAHSSPFQR